MGQNTDRMLRDAHRARQALDNLSDELIKDLVRRAGVRSTGEQTSSGPRAKGDHSDPTLGAVVRSMGRKAPDPIYDGVKDIARMLADIAYLSVRIDEKVRFVTEVKERARQAAILHCEACGREVAGTSRDRLRSGYCQACYRDWLRSGRPYRPQFEQGKKSEKKT